MQTLTIVPNLFDRSTWIEDLATDNVIETLMQKFVKFPHSARLYHEQVTTSNDVTPRNEDDIEKVKNLEGNFFAVVYPAEPLTIAYIVVAIVAVVALTALGKKIPIQATRNQQAASPNNALSSRTNQPRLNGRIPDIFGTVRATPDLIAVPYTVFINHNEFEYTYMAVGRGTYQINAAQIRDGQTAVQKIEGERVEIYGPNTSPNSGDAPQLRIGAAIGVPVISAQRSKSVNGQVLLAPNESAAPRNFSNLVGFVYPNKVAAISGNPVSFLPDFHVGDNIVITTSGVFASLNPQNSGSGGGGEDTIFYNYLDGVYNARFHSDGTIEMQTITDLGTDPHLVGTYIQLVTAIVTNGINTQNFSGKYIVTAAAGGTITLQSPSASNIAWGEIGLAFGGSVTPYGAILFKSPFDGTVEFNGTYKITSVADKLIELEGPANSRTNNNWVWMQGLSLNGGDSSFGFDGAVVTIGPISSSGGWIGPFVLDVATMNQVIANYIAVNGMYKDNGAVQTATSVLIQIGVTLCNEAGTLLAGEQYFTTTVVGSAEVQNTRAATLFGSLDVTGRYSVRSRRLTPKDLLFDGQIVDEVKWRDVYASSPIGVDDFGDCTTVYALTQGTEQALAVSERQLNMLVTRKLPAYAGGSTFGALNATNNAADIMAFICRDPKLGNRPDSEVDYQNFYDTIAEVMSYFGSTLAGEFNYTIDSDNLSFEETLQMVANAVFCTAHRRGNVIELTFERETEDSVLLFNHRNKVPKSEIRTSNFGGPEDGKDGIELEYVSPIDDAVIRFYIPADQSAVNPKKIETVGVRSTTLAYFHAWRAFNRLKYQTRVTEFVATQEAEVVSVNSRILVSDNTRPDTQDGEIESQNGLVLRLSQPAIIIPANTYSIYLQLPSGVVQILEITAGFDPYHVVLTSPPDEALSVADENVAKCVYQIVKHDDIDNRSFILTEKDSAANFTTRITAINYDARYYQNDKDFV